MSLSRIAHRLATARQNAGTAEDREKEAIGDFQAPHISLSAKWHTAAFIADENSIPLPLEALGSLLFSLSGHIISTTKEYFNVSQLDKCPQVLLVVIDNMSTLDLEEKPSLLVRFREHVRRNGLSARVLPALVADHSTGSELSQVRVNFQKDTAIIKHLLSETSGVRKLKTIDGEQPKRAFHGGAEEISLEDFDSGTESLDEPVPEPIETSVTQRIKNFQLKFPRRFEAKLNQRLRKVDHDDGAEPPRKLSRLVTEQESRAETRPDGSALEPTDPTESGYSRKLWELKRTLIETQRKIKKLREQRPEDEQHRREAEHEAMNLRQEFRSTKQEYELERAKCIQGESCQRNFCGPEEASEKKSNEDLLNLLDKMKTTPDSGRTLAPVGTVIDAGKLDRSKPEKFDRTLLLLSPSEMKAQGFILNNKPSRTSYAPVHSKSRLFGIDCEMCLTTNMTNELTRVTVVDEDGVVLMDSLVKPKARIINYLTQFSGITAEMMLGVTTRKETVLKLLEEILPPDGILVGHSLDSDLKALDISHPYCIDTSVCYGVKGSRQKSKLKVLVRTFLGEDIQTGGASGHCSAEDSYSALKLVLLKLQNDISFGDIDLKGDLEWNGINYEDALKAALQVVARERREQGPYRNVWAKRNTPSGRSSTQITSDASSSSRNPNLVAGFESRRSRDGEYYEWKRALHKLTEERRRQERSMREIRDAFKIEHTNSEGIARKIMKEAYMRRKRERRAREEKSQVDKILLQKLHEVENRRKQLLGLDEKTSSVNPSEPSPVLLLAKKKFLEQKLLDLEEAILDTPKTSMRAIESRNINRKRLRSDLAKLQMQIKNKKAEDAESSPGKQLQDIQSGAEPDEGDDDVSSADESEGIDPRTNLDPLTESEVIATLAENETALEQLRQEEEILREELARAALDLRRRNIETRVAAKHEHNEILAREIVNGLVDTTVIFRDRKLLHNFIEYQLFVLRKNEELTRKHGKSFGTIALDWLYLDMFTAWKSAGKKSSVVAAKEVAKINYDRVEIQAPEDESLSSTVKATRKCLRTSDLVVSHLSYDDVNENEASIENALDLLWERVKPAGVMIVLLEGTYHYKKLGHGLALLSIKSQESS